MLGDPATAAIAPRLTAADAAGPTQHGLARHGLARHGLARHGLARHGPGSTRSCRCQTDPMGSCCDPRGYDRTFNTRFARQSANRYRRRGLDKTAERIVRLVEEHGVQGLSVLEVGGGVGEIQLELLKRGAARTTNLELSSAYEPEAARLLAEAGMTDRVERRMVDIATAPVEVPPADVVVLNRVVCCYPDYEKLLGRGGRPRAPPGRVQSPTPQPPVAHPRRRGESAPLRVLGRDFRVSRPPASHVRRAVRARPGIGQDGARAGLAGHSRSAHLNDGSQSQGAS